MKKQKLFIKVIVSIAIIGTINSCSSCKQETKSSLKRVSTTTRPIQKQWKGTFDLGNGIYCSNDFAGARLNGVVLTQDTIVTALITPENTPINDSPWYAFKLWSEIPTKINLKITYTEGYAHRYIPKLSYDKHNWESVDSSKFYIDTASISTGKSPKFCAIDIDLGKDTLWVSAQELITTEDMNDWSNELSNKPYISVSEIGKSFEGRPINALQIGPGESDKVILVLSRQHPPEITGWLAMKWFVEELSKQNEKAEQFRDEYSIYVIPAVNPDGVENGHWRHGTGGVDLNRDWENFNQIETQVVRKFVENKTSNGSKIIVSIDFHSTLKDIYYTISPELKGNMPGLIPNLINAVGQELEGYDPVVEPNPIDEPRISSTNYFFHEHKAEALTYEVGDNTPRDFIRTKAEVTAQKLMELLLASD